MAASRARYVQERLTELGAGLRIARMDVMNDSNKLKTVEFKIVRAKK
jgi:hypothetical protein